ncbi:hypothetical protein K3495_g1684 [Podosphaera aphanis]|nr:hypothetical protein K3495_g1684 [Podosphaera aphanis]
MSLRNEQLMGDKKDLEEKNAKTQQTNRELFDHLEELSQSIAKSEVHIKALEATLDSTRYEFRRLQALAARTEDLEAQLATLEQEQEVLRSTIWTTQEQKQTADYRWKTAERRLSALQEQLESIDHERQEERERHEEIIARMKRRKAIDKESDSVAQRWKETAAASGLFKRDGSDIVSHFVKKILHDNANLQSGIIELQEMLSNSNDEVQILREQLTQHQPFHGRKARTHLPSLRAELAQKGKLETPIIAQNLRIHNHYYSSSKVEKSRRHRRKRSSLDSGLYSPPRTLKLNHRRHNTEHSTLSQMSLGIAGPTTPIKKRWSQQTGKFSDITASSATSSIPSKFWQNTIFDKSLDSHSSNPTSPGSSVDFRSPVYDPKRKECEISRRNTSTFIDLQEGVIYEDLNENAKIENPPEFEMFKVPFFFHPRSQGKATSISYSRSIVTRPSLVTARPTLVGQDHDSTFYLRSSMLIKRNETHAVQFRHTSNSSIHGNRENKFSVKTRLSSWASRRWSNNPKVLNTLQCSSERPHAATSSNRRRRASSKANLLSDRPAGINQKGTVPGFFKKSVSLPCQTLPVQVNHEALREVLDEDFATLKIVD